MGHDTRNIAGLEVVVIVQDVQDMPPIFTLTPPVTRLPSGLLPGDKVLYHDFVFLFFFFLITKEINFCTELFSFIDSTSSC